MSNKQTHSRAKTPAVESKLKAEAPKVTRTEMLIGLMRTDTGATAAELGAAVGWQVHSVRGFVAGTLKKRADLKVTTTRADGLTRYRVMDAASA